MRNNYIVTVQYAESAERDENSNHWLLFTKKTYVSYKLGKWVKTLNSHAITAGIFRYIVRSLRIQPSEALLRKYQLLEHGLGGGDTLLAEILITKKVCLPRSFGEVLRQSGLCLVLFMNCSSSCSYLLSQINSIHSSTTT